MGTRDRPWQELLTVFLFLRHNLPWVVGLMVRVGGRIWVLQQAGWEPWIRVAENGTVDWIYPHFPAPTKAENSPVSFPHSADCFYISLQTPVP